MTGMSTSHPPIQTNAVLTRVHSPPDNLKSIVAGDTWKRFADVVHNENTIFEAPVREGRGHIGQSGDCTHTCREKLTHVARSTRSDPIPRGKEGRSLRFWRFWAIVWEGR